MCANSSSLYKLFYIQCLFVCRWWPKRNDSELHFSKVSGYWCWGFTLSFETIFDKWKPFKNDEKCFLSHVKFFFRSFSLHPVLSWLFGYVEKQLDNKVKVNFKIYDVTDWATNNYNRHIAEYVSNLRHSVNEIWSISRI